MASKCKDAFEKAAKSIASFPEQYEDLKIRDNLPNQEDWDDLNTQICRELKKVSCTVVESELDVFWEDNLTFRELLDYFHANCNCN